MFRVPSRDPTCKFTVSITLRLEQKRDGYIPRSSRESIRPAAGIRPVGDVVQRIRIAIEHRVQEPHGALAGGNALLDDAVDHRREDGGT